MLHSTVKCQHNTFMLLFMNAMANTSTYLHVVAILSIFCYLFILYNRFPNTKFQLYLQQELVFVDCFFFCIKKRHNIQIYKWYCNYNFNEKIIAKNDYMLFTLII